MEPTEGAIKRKLDELERDVEDNQQNKHPTMQANDDFNEDPEASEDDDDDDEEEDEYGEDYDSYEAEKSYEVEEFENQLPGMQKLKFKMEVYKEEAYEDWMQAIVDTCNYEGKQIGHILGRHINRPWIRGDFHLDMEEPCQDMADLAFEVFDRYGFLKKEFKEHPIRKGTGVWGAELDHGIILLLETISIDVAWRRKGLGTFMVKCLTDKAMNRRVNPRTQAGMRFTLAIPEEETSGMSEKKAQDTRSRHLKVANDFFRSLGFRRIGASTCFARAVDPSHAAYSIAPGDDFEPEADAEEEDDNSDDDMFTGRGRDDPKFKRRQAKYPLHHKICQMSDDEVLEHLKSYMEKGTLSGNDWTKIDMEHHRLNLIHVAACHLQPKTLRWLIDHIDRDKSLRNSRNTDGYTPLEALQAQLESNCTSTQHGLMTVMMSDRFEGFCDEAIACLLHLSVLPPNPTPDAFLRIKYGCSCSQCVGGFISPRMLNILLTQAEINHDTLGFDIEDAESWVVMNDYQMENFPQDIVRNFRTNKSLRRGYTNLINYIAECLRHNEVPSIENVLARWRNAGEWPPVTKSFLERAGTDVAFAMALETVVNSARSLDIKAGDGMFFEVPQFKADYMALPECRNDHEFGFVALQLGVDMGRKAPSFMNLLRWPGDIEGGKRKMTGSYRKDF